MMRKARAKTEVWHKADIKAALEKLGLTLFDVDRAFNLPVGTCSATLLRPHRLGELAIAETLRHSPREIWPGRYETDGTRKCPQPAENYRPRAVGRHCQKDKAA